MIKRINEIKNIGAFRNFRTGSSIEFEKLTFIYGLNTKGKTTLADILSSLRDNDPKIIQNRKSIPEIEEDQTVKFQFTSIENERESSCIYRNGNWDSTDISKDIYVFGTEFIHRNLFTGLSIERENKKNLTQFIIGEEGVDLANSIVDDKKELRRRKRDLTNLIPPYVKGKSENDIKDFIELSIDDFNEEKLRDELIKLESKLVEEKKRLEEPERILSLPVIEHLEIPDDKTKELIARTNELLDQSYDDISEKALQKIDKHIENVFKEENDALSWIKKGIDSKKTDTDNCTFCGQSLSNAKELIEAYHSYFNEAYREFIENISNKIEMVINSWKTIDYKEKEKLIRELRKAEKYEKIIENENYRALLVSLRTQIKNLDENNLNESVKNINEELEETFSTKESKPFESIESKNFDEFNASLERYYDILQSSVDIIKNLDQLILDFRKTYSDLSEIKSKIEEIENEITPIKLKLTRIEQDDECKAYQNETSKISTLAKNIKSEEERLSTEQSDYLNDFFDKIDLYFKKLGSPDFALEKVSSRRGDHPVYSLLLKFKNVEINESNIGKVLSESDRRALALSVFWSKIELLDYKEKSQAIIVLDDPVTSFDDNRIILSIDVLKNVLKQVRQVIVLTHYNHFIRNFCNRTKNVGIDTSYIKIQQNNETSSFIRITQDHFTISQYEKVFNKINGFILREHNQDIRSDLRPFLESLYLPYFYIDRIKEAKKNEIRCITLSEKINAIFEEGEIRDRFHHFRETLNSDSHIFTENNKEDIRSFAREMMSFLYDFDYNIEPNLDLC